MHPTLEIAEVSVLVAATPLIALFIWVAIGDRRDRRRRERWAEVARRESKP
jgi:hypothetical protein